MARLTGRLSVEGSEPREAERMSRLARLTQCGPTRRRIVGAAPPAGAGFGRPSPNAESELSIPTLAPDPALKVGTDFWTFVGDE